MKNTDYRCEKKSPKYQFTPNMPKNENFTGVVKVYEFLTTFSFIKY